MSCPRFPYGRFNFSTSNKKMYPQVVCSLRMWTLTLKKSGYIFSKGTEITQTDINGKVLKGILVEDVSADDDQIKFSTAFDVR